MTDQQMDTRLRTAGERFRAANPGPAPAVDAVGVAEATPTSWEHRPRWLLAAAAAAVVALVVGLTIALRGSAPTRPPSVDNAGLVGNVWLLTTGGQPSTAALYISRSGVLVADDECRLISSDVRVDAARIIFADPAVRLKPCLDRGFAPAFNGVGTRVLQGTAQFHIDSAGMTITRRGVGSLRFVLAQTPVPPPSVDIPTLTGTDWVAPNGKVLHIDPITGQLSGGYCGGRASVVQLTVSFTDCPAAGIRFAVVTGSTLTLKGVIGNAPPSSVPPLVFRWRPTSASIDPASMTGRTWHLETVAGRAASSGSFRIDGTTAVVDDGCTTYRRSVSVGTGTFTIAGGVPAHACSDQASTADSFLFNHPATWAVRDGKLIVYGGGSQEFALVYGSAAPTALPPTSSQLIQRTWQVQTVTYGMRAYRAGAGTADPAVLTFSRTSYRLALRCEDRSGAAFIRPGLVTMTGGRVLDAHSCPSAPNPAADRAIVAVLSGQIRWSVVGGVLTLRSNAGTLVLHSIGGNVNDLTGSTWRLTGTDAGARMHRAIGEVVLGFPNQSTLSVRRCYTSQASVDVTTTELYIRNLHVTTAVPCPSGLPGTQQQNDFIDRVLSGALTWHIAADQLTVSSGVDSLTFTRLR